MGLGTARLLHLDPMCYIDVASREPVYVGPTTDLVQRVTEHREGRGSRHAGRYQIKRNVWYEAHDSIDAAQTVERRLKRWNREWKDELIEKFNPEWRDLPELA